MKLSKTNILLLFFVCVSFASCNQLVKKSSPRSIVLDGKVVTETEPGQFESWRCRDFVYRNKGHVEVGLTSNLLKIVSGYIYLMALMKGQWQRIAEKGLIIGGLGEKV